MEDTCFKYVLKEYKIPNRIEITSWEEGRKTLDDLLTPTLQIIDLLDYFFLTEKKLVSLHYYT